MALRSEQFVGYRNVRCRVTRLATAHSFTGWISDVTFDVTMVEGCQESGFEPGEMFIVEINGVQRRLVIKCSFSAALPGVLLFNNMQPPGVQEPTEPARAKVRHMSYEFEWEGSTHRGTVHDISEEGVGLDCAVPLAVGYKVPIKIDHTKGQIEATMEVRHSAAVHSKRFETRLGAKLSFEDRLSMARWRTVIEQYLRI